MVDDMGMNCFELISYIKLPGINVFARKALLHDFVLVTCIVTSIL